MIYIHWKNRPSNYDTGLVDRVWFPTPTTVYYTCEGNNFVYSAKTKDIEQIVTLEAHNQIRKA